MSTARINRRLIPAIRAAERAELIAVASRDPVKADAYAAEWDIPCAFGSYEALVDDADIDIVYISLPNNLHADWTVRAAERGKHVLCEKPLALSPADCDRIMAAAEAHGIVVAEAVMYLYHPLIHKVRQLVQEGAVGQVRLVRGAFTVLLDRPKDVRWKPELGGGSLWDIGSYPVSFIRAIAGEPDEVFGWQTLSESGVDTAFAGLLRYRNGALGIFDCGFDRQFRVHAEIVGDEGSLIIHRPYLFRPESRLRLNRGFEEERIQLPAADAYRCEVEALTAAILDGSELPVPLASSRANVATLVALHGSARRGEPLAVAGIQPRAS